LTDALLRPDIKINVPDRAEVVVLSHECGLSAARTVEPMGVAADGIRAPGVRACSGVHVCSSLERQLSRGLPGVYEAVILGHRESP
jgi:hypothetical protein